MEWSQKCYRNRKNVFFWLHSLLQLDTSRPPGVTTQDNVNIHCKDYGGGGQSLLADDTYVLPQ